jgi:deazaflavin-dependent oxidoreductase (nitroreductase family)
MNIGNWFNKTLLMSPLHGLVSGSVVLLTIVGKNSGKVFSTPVNYIQDENDLFIISLRNRKWWRNLRESCPVTVQLRGKTLHGQAIVLEKQAEVVNGLKMVLARAPKYAKYIHVTADSDGKWDPASLDHTACSKVVVKITLPQTDPIENNE